MAQQVTNVAELRQKAKLPAKQAGGSTVQAFFEANKSTLQAVLPKHVSADRLLKLALGALRQNPKLMECSIESLFGAIVWCAQLGLEPNTPMGHAYLIPFKVKGVMQVQCVIGYRGLIDLARRSGQIVSLAAHEVCRNDEFDFAYGLDERLSHKPALADRGDVIAYYAVAKLQGGGYAFEVMSTQQIEAIRDRDGSNAWSDVWENGRKTGKREKARSPWWDHPVEMGRKTVIRRLSKYLPISIEMQDAVAADGAVGKQKFDDVLEGHATVIDDTPDAEGADNGEPPQAIEEKAPDPIVEEMAKASRNDWTPDPEEEAAIRAAEVEEAQRERGGRRQLDLE